MSKALSISVVTEQLKGYLAELEAIPQLPKACSPEALADHETWMATREQIRQLVRQAEWSALMTVPDEITSLLKAIDARKNELMHLTVDK